MGYDIRAITSDSTENNTIASIYYAPQDRCAEWLYEVLGQEEQWRLSEGSGNAVEIPLKKLEQAQYELEGELVEIRNDPEAFMYGYRLQIAHVSSLKQYVNEIYKIIEFLQACIEYLNEVEEWYNGVSTGMVKTPLPYHIKDDILDYIEKPSLKIIF